MITNHENIPEALVALLNTVEEIYWGNVEVGNCSHWSRKVFARLCPLKPTKLLSGEDNLTTY